MGSRRPQSGGPGKELDNEVLKKVLRDSLAKMRELPGETGKAVRLSKSDWNATADWNELAISGLERDERRGDYINVDGLYLKLDDPVPCAETGAAA